MNATDVSLRTICVWSAVLFGSYSGLLSKTLSQAEDRVDGSGQATDAAAKELPVRRLAADKLLVYEDECGNVQQVKTIEDWQIRRRSIIDAMQAVMGPLPQDVPKMLNVRVVSEESVDNHVRRLIEIESRPGDWLPAFLLVPKKCLDDSDCKAPAVLCLHPTDNNIGHGVVVGLGGRANRQYASELAERGYVTIAPSYPLLANYQPDLNGTGFISGTMRAIWDNQRCLDYLDSLPFVEPGPRATIGHSLGGHNSVYTAVFDERLHVVVTSCGLDSYVDYYDGVDRVWQPEQGWTQTRYIPNLRHYRGRLDEIPFDFHEMVAAIAPRYVMIAAPQHDGNFRAASVDRVAAAARSVFKLHDAGDNLTVFHPDCDHDFPPEMREKAYELIDSVLCASDDSP